MKKFCFVIFCFFSCFKLYSNEIDLKTLPNPYNQLKEIKPFDAGIGMYTNAPSMEVLLKEHNVKNVIEVGSWYGMSTMHIAENIPEDGVVYAIDSWCGSSGDNYFETMPKEQLDASYDQFLSNVIHKGLTNKIIPIKQDSLTAAKSLTNLPEIDLIYIDANHLYENVLKDLEAWYPFVKGHGILCGDDWGWGDRNIARAVEKFANDNDLIVHTNGWFWALEEK